jgi:hypothetical protein
LEKLELFRPTVLSFQIFIIFRLLLFNSYPLKLRTTISFPGTPDQAKPTMGPCSTNRIFGTRRNVVVLAFLLILVTYSLVSNSYSSMLAYVPAVVSQQNQMDGMTMTAVTKQPTDPATLSNQSQISNGYTATTTTTEADEPIMPRFAATTTTTEAKPIVPRLVSDNGGVESGEIQNSKNTFRAPQVFGLTYGTAPYANALNRIKQEADESELFKSFEICRAEDLDASFVDRFRDVLKLPRGAGYWIWKVPLIQRHLKRLEYGDILVYLDAGCKVEKEGTDRFWWYVKQMQRTNTSIVAFELPFAEQKFTTDAIFKYFNITPNTTLWKKVAETGQYVGGILVMRKTPQLESILAMYNQTLYDDPYLFTDSYNSATKAKRGNFKDNRHDQSVFGVIRKLFPNDTFVVKGETRGRNPKKPPFVAARARGF